MQLTSSAFGHNEPIPVIYTCDGDDINPPLQISGVPENTQSLVLIMLDPDVPQHAGEDGIWDHWIVFNIPPSTTDIPAGQEPPGLHGVGTSSNLKYHGPCPPDKEHRYFFKLYALDVSLDLPEGVTKQQVEEAMQDRVIEQTELIGLYNRE